MAMIIALLTPLYYCTASIPTVIGQDKYQECEDRKSDLAGKMMAWYSKKTECRRDVGF
jgi:hypothetical protein